MKILRFVNLFCLLGALASAQAPLLEQTDLFESRMDGHLQYRIPVLLTTNAGTLLALCEARVDKPGDAPNNIDVVMKRSSDHGRSWSRLDVLMGNGDGAAGDPTGLVDRETGTIWVFANFYPEGFGSVNVSAGLTGNTANYVAIKSEDDGRTWSDPINLTGMLKEPHWRGGSIGPGTGIQMRNGRLVLPRYYFDTPIGETRTTTSFVSYSDDHGKTWTNGGMVSPAGATNECQVVELTDGSLMMNLRNEVSSGEVFRKVARSFDGGESWTVMKDDPVLIEPIRGCQASLFVFTDTSTSDKNRLLFTNPASLRRNNFTVQMSYDEGKTWPVVRQLHGGFSAYSSLTVLPDKTIGCLYEGGDNYLYEKIVFTRFNVEWLSGGKDHLKQ